ncbi:hypothetical protein [Rhodococcus sp. AH-ZY2]|uniref:hypothetical protein n=1 Tax=Rhodococcus TaxID=1827 RepID=UPI0027E1A95E|nr:hypothetical protein [Rhodococcus sp. AH-ZY2]WML60917.1 hypothetical protein QNA09_00780 [Rhodococcus sp. AH-ZY2]
MAELQRALRELTQFLSSRISPERYFIRKSGSWYKRGLYSPRGYLLSRSSASGHVYVLTADGRIWRTYGRSDDPEYVVLKPQPGPTWSYLTKIGSWDFDVDPNGTVTASYYPGRDESRTVKSMQDALAGMAATAIEEHKNRGTKQKGL